MTNQKKMISISKGELKETDDDRGFSGKTAFGKDHWNKLVEVKKTEQELIKVLNVADKRSKKYEMIK